MMQEVNAPIDETNYLNIVERAEKLEQLYHTIKDLKKEKPDIYKSLGTDKEKVDAFVTQQYSKIGDLLNQQKNIDAFKAQIQNVFTNLQQNLQAMFTSIVEQRKLGFGNGNGTGNGNGDGNGSGNGTYNKETEEEIKRITDEITNLTSQIDEARKKLEELKNGTKITDNLDSKTKSGLISSIKTDIAEMVSELDKFGDNIPLEKAQKFIDLITTYYKLGGEAVKIAPTEKLRDSIADIEDRIYNKYDTDDADFEGKPLTSYINTSAIQEQEKNIDELINKLHELEEQKQRLLGQPGKNTENGEGKDNVSVEAKPDGSKFIEELQKQIDGQFVTVGVKIDDSSVDDMQEKLDGILDSKHIKIGSIDYDKVPLMTNAAGKIIDVFRGMHGVFGFSGKDGITWFTDELEMASQYADSLAEDGKIIRANLSFKNPLEIFGNNADYDKIDISEHLDVSRMAEKMGFNPNKMLTDDIVQVAKNLGYDGVIFRDIKDGYDDLAHTVFATVDQIQVKNEELYASIEKGSGQIAKIESEKQDKNYEIELKVKTENLRSKIEEALKEPFEIQFDVPNMTPNYPVATSQSREYTNQAKKDIEEAQSYLERLKSDISRMDSDGIVSRYLYGENGVKSSQQLVNEIQNEVKAINDVLYQDYSNGRRDINYEKEFEASFNKLRLSQDFGRINYTDKILPDYIQQIYNNWIKKTPSITSLLDDDQMSFWGGMIDAQERLNTLQKNGGKDYEAHLERIKQLSDEVQATREKNISFQKTDIDKTVLSQEDATKRAEGLLKEKEAVDQLIESVTKYHLESKQFADIDSYFGNYLPDISDLKAMSEMLEDEADLLKTLDIRRNGKQADIFDSAVDYKFKGKHEAPRELENYWEELSDSFYPKQGQAPFSGEEAIERLNQKAKELGVTFDETAKKWVQISSTAPSDILSQPSNQNIPSNDLSARLAEEQRVAEQAVQVEEHAFDNLISKLTTEVPEAVDTKTQAFRSEQVEVDNLIDLEINKIKELAETLQTAFATSGNVQDFGALRDLIQAINDFSNGENISTNLETLSAAVQGLVNALKGASDISNASNQLADLMRSMKVSKANVDNMIDLATAIEMLVEQFRNLGKSAAMPNILQPINDILKNAEALKDLSKVLSVSAKERRAASVQAGVNPDVNEKKANNAAEKQLDNLMQYYALQDEKNQRKVSGKNERVSLTAIAKEEKLLRAINEYEAEIAKKKQNGISLTEKEVAALEKRKELEKTIADRREEYEKAQADAAEKNLKNRTDKIRNSYDDIQKELDNNLSINQEFFTPELDQKVAEIKRKFQELRDIQLVDQEDINKAEKLRTEINKAIAELKNDPNYKAANANTRTALQAKAGKWLEKNTAAPESLRNQISQLYSELSSDVPVSRLKEISAELNRIDAEAAKAGKTGKSFVDMLGVSFKNLGRYLLSFASFYRVIGIFRQAVGIVKELDTALMEVRKVSSESLSSLKEWQQLTFNQANDIGGTAQQIQESTAAWLRLGKSFEEASEAAQASVKLLNVSEFTNIDDATTSLVSMRQAFKDLSYEDFIDKLNGVGDNFSSNTDQLAFGMRNVSSVLKVAGNDIDQSLALLTAANDITQDMSKASMGVRTVALRIAGTEDAKAELEELGEDTSDFIVQTQSKVDAKVRKYTATADNPNGISVLDDNGRLRSTYDILLDISKVYDQIVEKDNQFGTNTSNALLELLAGKTRSNILASILQNPTVLEEAYTQSQNSKGIGQKELDIYLDSIQAKMTKLQNALQKLASVTINSDWLKVFVDLGTGAVKIFSTLTEKLGSFSTVIAPIISMFIQRKGFGMLGSKNGAGIISMLLGNISDSAIKKELSPLQKQMQNVFSGMKFNDDDNFFTTMAKRGLTPETMKTSELFGPMLKDMDGAEAASLSMGTAVATLNERLGMTGEVAVQTGGTLSSLAGGLATVGKSFLSVGLTTIAITVATKVIEGLVKAVYNWVTADERAIEAGKKAREEAEQLAKSYADTEKKTNELGKRYNELRQGVFYDERKGYSNKSLSEDEFEEFLKVNEDIVALYPRLKEGTDAQGNAYVNLGDNATQATEKLKEYLRIQEQISNEGIGKTFDDQLAGAVAKEAELRGIIQNTNLDSTTLDILDNGIDDYIQRIDDNYNYYTLKLEELGTVNRNTVDSIQQVLNENDSLLQFDTSAEGFKQIVTFTFEMDEDSEAKIREQLSQAINGGADYSTTDAVAGLREQVESYEEEIVDAYDSTRPALLAKIKETKTYKDLPQELQEGISNIYDNIDIYQSYKNYENYKKQHSEYSKDFYAYIKEQYLYAINKAINQSDDSMQRKEKADLVGKLFSFDASDLNSAQAINQIDTILSSIFGENTEVKQSIKVALGIDFVDPETGEVISDKYKKQNQELYDILKNYGLSRGDVGKGLTIGEKDTIQSAISSGEFNFIGGGLEKLKKWLEKEYQPVFDGTLSDIFNDASYKENTEEISSNISTISSSLETLRNNGKLTAEEMMKLQESFPDMTEFTEEALSSRGVELLSKWIKELRKDYDTLSDEGKEQVDTYVNNLMSSFGDVIATENEARTAIYGALFDSHATDTQKQAQAEQIEETIKALQDKYGEQLDWNIVWQLAVNDQLSGEMDDIYNRYDERVLNWDIIVNIPKEVEQLERNIAGRNARISAIEAEKGYYDATGEYLPDINENWFDEMLRLSGQNVADKTVEYTNAQKTYTAYTNGLFGKILGNASPELSSGAYKAMAEARAAMVQAMTEQTDIQKQYYEFQANMYTKEIEEAQTNAAKVQARIDQAEFEGVMPAETDYAELRDAYKTQAEMQEGLANFWDTVANSGKVNSVMRAIANQNAATARANVISANESANEADRGYLTDELLEKQNTYNDLQTEASQIEQQITDDETKHRKISNKRYDELIKNGDKQLANLENQRETLVELRDKTIQGTDKWREYQSQIDDVDSSISNMQNSQVGWFESMTTAVSSNAQTLASALDSAFSEINSETGLTRDTMNTLVEQFSDLENYDVSKIFYSTADGMKFNTDATRELIDAEYDLQVNNLRDAIAEETAIIEANKDSKDANAYATMQQAQSNIDAYNAELAALQALYDQQQESLSRYSAWETAKSTANAGDKYTNLQGSWKDIQEMWDNGLTGTDDFQSFVAFFDQWGMGTVEAYERNKAMISRYVTEDGSGMKNFYDDLVAKGFGTYEDGIYNIAMPDTEEAARAMGMSEEALKMFMMRGEDYGFTNTWVDTVLEGELKLQDTTEQLIEEQERLRHMQESGASEKEIADQQAVVDQIRGNMKNYIENTADVVAEDNTKTYAKTIEQLKAINELRGENFGAEVEMTERERATYNKQLDDAMQQALGGYSKDELISFKAEFEAEMDDDSKRIVDQMIELAGQKEAIKAQIDAEVQLHDSEGNGITPEEYLAMTNEEKKAALKASYGNAYDESQQELWDEAFKEETVVAKVKAVIDTSGLSYDDLLGMNAEQLTQTIGVEVDESNIDAIKAQIEEMSAVKVSLDETSVTSLTTALSEALAIAIGTDGASEQVEGFVEETEDKTATIDIDADTDQANHAVQQFISNVTALHPSISVICDASSLVESVSEILARQQFKVNVSANAPSVPSVVKPSKQQASGDTAINGRNNGPAYANGKPGDLVGELGREIVVDPHTGRYYTVGDNGPEFTNIPDDAIVFNADQTDDLLKHGHTSTHGRALVTGNAFGSNDQTSKTRFNKIGNTFGKGVGDKATKDNTKATKDNTKASKEQKTALDKFNEWLGKWVDWIDNRIDTLTNRIERFEKTAEQAIGYVAKNKNVQKAMNTLSNLKTFQQGKLLTKSVTGTNGVTAQIATGTKNAKKGTLLGDTMRGAVRYQQQADKVMKKAVKSGLLSQKKANEIAKLIQTGEIDIRKYNEKVRAVISAYEDLFGKSQDLIDSTYDLKQQFKDLEQTKLDNITERFETLVGLFEAANALSEAAVDYYSERGRAVNTVDKTEMGFQLERQGRITQELEKERTAYETEMKQAKAIFGESSNEYRQARTQFYQIQEELKKSQTSELSLKHAIEELTFTVRGFVIDRIQSFVSKLGNIASLAEKRGTNKALGYEVTEDVFNEQIGYNNDLILKYAEDLQARKDEIARRTVEEGLEINSDAYQELYNKIVADEDAMYKLYSANEDLKMSIRNLRWKPFKEFQETLDKIESDFNHIQSFIREGELLDEDGQFTARGFTQIALIGENMDVAEKKIANARAAIEKLNDELEVGTINEETFGEEFEQQMKIIQDSASEAYDAMQKLADMYIKQITEENSILQDLIKSRQDALSKKKA